MISQSAEYALRAVVRLGEGPDARMSTARIAEATKVPAGYLSKVLQGLARAGLVVSVPGRIGGFRLSRQPASITVLDVVNAVDPVRRIKKCPLGLRSHHTGLCPLHRRLDEAAEAVERAYAATTIAEILEDPSSIRALREAS
jgi:Rrf2 family protein